MSERPKAIATRARIVEAASEELLATGGDLQLSTVARTAGVVPSVVSHHFGSRAGLVRAVVDGFYDRLHAEVLDRDLRDLGPWQVRERERVKRGVRFYFSEPLAPVVLGPLSRDSDVAAAETGRIEQVIETSARNIAAARRERELPRGVEPRLAAAAIFGASRQITVAAVTSARRPTQKAVAALVWRVTLAAVGLPLAEPAPNR